MLCSANGYLRDDILCKEIFKGQASHFIGEGENQMVAELLLCAKTQVTVIAQRQ